MDRVSILTLAGRPIIPVVLGGYHRARLDRIWGQAHLVYRGVARGTALGPPSVAVSPAKSGS